MCKIIPFFSGCLLSFSVNALQCYEAYGKSPNSGYLAQCEDDNGYCQVNKETSWWKINNYFI